MRTTDAMVSTSMNRTDLGDLDVIVRTESCTPTSRMTSTDSDTTADAADASASASDDDAARASHATIESSHSMPKEPPWMRVNKSDETSPSARDIATRVRHAATESHRGAADDVNASRVDLQTRYSTVSASICSVRRLMIPRRGAPSSRAEESARAASCASVVAGVSSIGLLEHLRVVAIANPGTSSVRRDPVRRACECPVEVYQTVPSIRTRETSFGSLRWPL